MTDVVSRLRVMSFMICGEAADTIEAQAERIRVLYGDNLQDGVAGFGKSPADAMWDFDRNWSAALTPTPPKDE